MSDRSPAASRSSAWQEQARLEVELYVRVWQALHGIGIDFLEEST